MQPAASGGQRPGGFLPARQVVCSILQNIFSKVGGVFLFVCKGFCGVV